MGVKRQWGCRKRQFLVFVFAISSEALVVRPILLYSRPIIQSLTAFTLTPKYVTLSDRENVTLSDCERSFYVKFRFVLSNHVQNLLFPYTESCAIISILGIDNIVGDGHTR